MLQHSLRFLLILVGFSVLASCAEKSTAPKTESPAMEHDHNHSSTDVHTFAEPNKAQVKHLELDLSVNFDTKILSGSATWVIDLKDGNEIIFDTRDLTIDRVTYENGDGLDQPAEWKLGAPSDRFPGAGQPLQVNIGDGTTKVTIHYSTAPDAGALQWLSAQQTTDKKHPFLFTQGQAVLTRTWIPCQDSPGIRITYDAKINVPNDLMAVMSASNPTEKSADGSYSFSMPQPIPPYLIALAVGDLNFRSLGPRTGVYAEPSVVTAAAYEFGDMEKMLVAAERLYGTYVWDRYDVIVLPASFPFGGMENPRLTFATPTILAGDRSLTSLIAHELAHSWSGNLVTNATWDDFWLNEGFTVYFEHRIMEALYGKDYTYMLQVLGRQDLDADIADLDAKDTHLKLALEGRNPDDGMTDIAYEKGALFLRTLEQTVGRARFDAFLKDYFSAHQFQTMTTDKFIDYLNANLLKPNNIDFDYEAWIFGAGIPEGAATVSSDRFTKVDAAIEQIVAGADPQTIATKEWTTHEWLHFIRNLPVNIDVKRMRHIDVKFGFSSSGNAEILAAWFEKSIRNGHSDHILEKIEAFLVRVGRRKFLTPIYTAFKERGQTKTACAIYEKARPNYHEVSRQTMDALLGCAGN